jgi:ureidoglycolate lyase
MEYVLLPVQPLTREAFAPYGDVIDTEGAQSFLINVGTTRRYHDLASIDTLAEGGRPIVSIFRAVSIAQLPLTIREVERHPLGSQAFIPLGDLPFLVVVASEQAESAPLTPAAFITNGRQGVNYRRGVWHHPLLAFHQGSDYVVIDRGGSGDNCEVIDLGYNYRIEALP